MTEAQVEPQQADTGTLAAPTVKFGSASATNVVVVSATEITCTVPAGSGAVDVEVTTDGGTDKLSSAFTYEVPPPPAPTLTSIDPATGPAAGGTTVTLTGTNFQ